MRTTLNLADDVYEAARVLARSSSRPLGVVISDLARQGLAPVRRATAQPDDLPLVRREPGDGIIPSDRVNDLLAEEGLD